MTMCRALSLIDELLDSGWYARPKKTIERKKNTTIISQSYRRFALMNLQEFLQSCPDSDPIMLIGKYREAMSRQSCANKTEEYRYVFAQLYEVATEVLDLLIVA